MSEAVLDDGVIYKDGFEVVGGYEWVGGEPVVTTVSDKKFDTNFFHSLWLKLNDKMQKRDMGDDSNE